MKGFIGKIETVSKTIRDEDGNKMDMPFNKISLYVTPEEFPDVIHYRDGILYFFTENPEIPKKENIVLSSKEVGRRLVELGHFLMGKEEEWKPENSASAEDLKK